MISIKNMLISKVLKEAEFKGFAGERSIDEQALKTISNDYQYSGVVNPHHLKK